MPLFDEEENIQGRRPQAAPQDTQDSLGPPEVPPFIDEKPPEQAQPSPFPGTAGFGEQIKEDVGYPDEGEGQEDFLNSDEPGPESESQSPPAQEPAQEQPPFTQEQPDFAQEPPEQAIPPGQNPEDMQKVAQSVSDGLKQELENKIDALSEDVAELKKLEEQISRVVGAMEMVEKKYEELEKKSEESPVNEDIEEVKTTVNDMSTLLSTALPAIAKSLKDMKKA